jgi:hypothetical protein
MRYAGVFVVCLASCAGKSQPQNLQHSEYFVIVTEGLAEQLKVDLKGPEIYVSPEGQVGARFALYNMGKKASMRITVSATLSINDAEGKERRCVASTVVNAGEPDGVENGRTWSSGDITFVPTRPECPPCTPGACRGSITISYINQFISSTNGAAEPENVPVTHTFTFDVPPQP